MRARGDGIFEGGLPTGDPHLAAEWATQAQAMDTNPQFEAALGVASECVKQAAPQTEAPALSAETTTSVAATPASGMQSLELACNVANELPTLQMLAIGQIKALAVEFPQFAARAAAVLAGTAS